MFLSRMLNFLLCQAIVVAAGVALAGDVSAQNTSFTEAQMASNAKRNAKYCNLGSWNSSWLGPQNKARSYAVISLSGTDLSYYRANVEQATNLLYRMNVAAARSNQIAPLKKFLLSMASQSHFTKLKPFRPTTWNGKKPSWISSYNPYNEPAFYGAILLIAAAQSYAILEPYLTAPEQKLLMSWGGKVFKASSTARDSKKGVDRMAAKAAGFVSWGLVSGNAHIFKKGQQLFRRTVKADITRNGRSRFFTRGYQKGRELKYMNMTYGFLSVAALALEAKGQQGFGFNKGKGSLVDGLNYLISRSLDSSKRQRISKNQTYLKWLQKPRHVTTGSWAFLEYAARSPTAVKGIPMLNKALSYRKGQGFFSGYYGGYTSCLIGR